MKILSIDSDQEYQLQILDGFVQPTEVVKVASLAEAWLSLGRQRFDLVAKGYGKRHTVTI